jgi:hypothetical protein
VNETEHFVNDGFGWECKRCRESAAGDEARGVGDEARPHAAGSLGRFFREGEAEAGGVRLSTAALARWKDETRKALACPACGVEEEFAG